MHFFSIKLREVLNLDRVSSGKLRTSMKNLRKYGKAPFNIALIHGGPGASGEMVLVARELAAGRGILEPLQRASSLEGQVEELKNILEKNGNLPLTLIGFSWGAWLSFLVTAQYPEIIKKLILISSGSFEEKYASGMLQIRLSRLRKDERKEVKILMEALDDPAAADKSGLFARFGELFLKADAYDPISQESEIIDYQVDIFQSVWRDAAELRRNGKLLQFGEEIKCPVVAIHGDYDSHPAQGVEDPLSVVLKDFRFILLKNCGHKPWLERLARDDFFRILKEEIA